MNETKFDYKVSVIVPIYNVEKYLGECLDSLVEQTMEKSEMEVLLIIDGSPDNSIDIAKKYAELHSFFKVFEKKNEGLSSTRNFGIKRAKGKYIMYLDSDDKYSSNTIRDVVDFFDTVYDEVDEVEFFIQPYKDGNYEMKPHFRYEYYLKETGVYSLDEYPYICQTNINICVKNQFEDNILFDTTPGFMQEDQDYNNKILRKKMKIGYCAEGIYFYNKNNESSIVTSKFNAINLFEESTAYFERLFSWFDEEVPRYYQAMFVNDIRWKESANILYPFHYEGEEWNHAIDRIKRLLARVDIELICQDPNMTDYRKCHLIEMKPNANIELCFKQTNGKVLIGAIDKDTGNEICEASEVIVKIVKIIETEDNKPLFRGIVKSPFFAFINENPIVNVCENDDIDNLVELKTHPSKENYGPTSIQIYNFCTGDYLCDANIVKKFQHFANIKGHRVSVKYAFTPMSAFSYKGKKFSYVRGDAIINYADEQFYIKKISKQKIKKFEIGNTIRRFVVKNRRPRCVFLRLNAIKIKSERRIWLYSDLYTVKKDNGYYQFINDFYHCKEDGIERYYVYTRPLSEIEDLFDSEMRPYLVEFGSKKHKILYLAAELILSGFYGRGPISPFLNEKTEIMYYDIEHFKVIYLQHGVLHASLRAQNSVDNSRADKIVISSPFERNNYINNYHYNGSDLIESGMARYDYLNFNKKPQNKILFAPSWRNYFAPNTSTCSWQAQKNAIKKSEWFINIQKFITSPTLHEVLKKYGYTLELKLHPIIASETDIFENNSEYIAFADSEVDVAEYRVFMTDFSSYVFDFAPLVRPILYFVPDYKQFKSGMGHYRDLDLPFDEAFGPMTTDPKEAIENLRHILNNDCVPEYIYKERMENFFVPLENCAEKLYRYLVDYVKK